MVPIDRKNERGSILKRTQKERGMEMDVNMCVLEKCNILCHWNRDRFFFVHGKQTKINSEWEGQEFYHSKVLHPENQGGKC